jgi:hypothetical protein
MELGPTYGGCHRAFRGFFLLRTLPLTRPLPMDTWGEEKFLLAAYRSGRIRRLRISY